MNRALTLFCSLPVLGCLCTTLPAEDYQLHKFERRQLTDVYFSEGANAGAGLPERATICLSSAALLGQRGLLASSLTCRALKRGDAPFVFVGGLRCGRWSREKSDGS